MNIQEFKDAFVARLAKERGLLIISSEQSPNSQKNKKELDKYLTEYDGWLSQIENAPSIPAVLNLLRPLSKLYPNDLLLKKIPGILNEMLTEIRRAIETSDKGEEHPSFAVATLLCGFIKHHDQVGAVHGSFIKTFIRGQEDTCFNTGLIAVFFLNLPIDVTVNNLEVINNVWFAPTEECFLNNVARLRLEFSEENQRLINDALQLCCNYLNDSQNRYKNKSRLINSLQNLQESPLDASKAALAVLPASEGFDRLQPHIDNQDADYWLQTMARLAAVPLESHQDGVSKTNAVTPTMGNGVDTLRVLSDARKYSQLISTDNFLLAIMDAYCSEARVKASNCKRKDQVAIKAARINRCRQLCAQLGLSGMPRSMSGEWVPCHDNDVLQQEGALWQSLEPMLLQLFAIMKKPGNTALAACSVMDLHTLSSVNYYVSSASAQVADVSYNRYLAQTWLAKLARSKGHTEYYDVMEMANELRQAPAQLRAFIPQYAGCTIVSAPTLATYEEHTREAALQRVVLFEVSTGLVHYYDQNAQRTTYNPRYFSENEFIACQLMLSAPQLTVWTDDLFCKRLKEQLPQLIESYFIAPHRQAAGPVNDGLAKIKDNFNSLYESLGLAVEKAFSGAKTRRDLLKTVEQLANADSFQEPDKQRFCNRLRALVSFEPLSVLGIPGVEHVDVLSLVDQVGVIDASVDDFTAENTSDTYAAISRQNSREKLQDAVEAAIYYVLTYGDLAQKELLFELLKSERYMQDFVWHKATSTFIPKNMRAFEEKGLDPNAQVWFSILCVRLQKWLLALHQPELREQQCQHIGSEAVALKQSELWQQLSSNVSGEGKVLRDRQCTYLRDLLNKISGAVTVFNSQLQRHTLEDGGVPSFKELITKLQSDLQTNGNATPLFHALTSLDAFSINSFIDTYAPLTFLEAFKTLKPKDQQAYQTLLTQAATVCVEVIVATRYDSGDWTTNYTQLIERLKTFDIDQTVIQSELLSQLYLQLKQRVKQQQPIWHDCYTTNIDTFTEQVQRCVTSLGKWPSSTVDQSHYRRIVQTLLKRSLHVCQQHNWSLQDTQAIPQVFESLVDVGVPEAIMQLLRDNISHYEAKEKVEIDSKGIDSFKGFLAEFEGSLKSYQKDRQTRLGSIFNNTKAKRLGAVKQLLADIAQLQSDTPQDLASFKQYESHIKKLSRDLEKIIDDIQKREGIKRKIGRKSGSTLLDLCAESLKQLKVQMPKVLWRSLHEANVDASQAILDSYALDRIIAPAKFIVTDHADEEGGESETRSVLSEATGISEMQYLRVYNNFEITPLVQIQNKVRTNLLKFQQSLLAYQQEFIKNRWTRFWVAKDRKDACQELLDKTEDLLSRLNYKLDLMKDVSAKEGCVQFTLAEELNEFWQLVEAKFNSIDKESSRLRNALKPYAQELKGELYQQVTALSHQYTAALVQNLWVKNVFDPPSSLTNTALSLNKALYLQAVKDALSSLLSNHSVYSDIFSEEFCIPTYSCNQLFFLFTNIEARLRDKFGHDVIDQEELRCCEDFQQILLDCERIGVRWIELALNQPGFPFESVSGGLEFVKRLTWSMWFQGFEATELVSDRERITQLDWLLRHKTFPSKEFTINDSDVFYGNTCVSYFKALLTQSLAAVLNESEPAMLSHALVRLYLDIHSVTLEDDVGDLNQLDILFGLFSSIKVDENYPNTIERLLKRVLDIVAHPNMSHAALNKIVEKMPSVLQLVNVQRVLESEKWAGILTPDERDLLDSLVPKDSASKSSPDIRATLLEAARQSHNLPLIEFADKSCKDTLTAQEVAKIAQAYEGAAANWRESFKHALYDYIEVLEEGLNGKAPLPSSFDAKNIYYFAWLVQALAQRNAADEDLQKVWQEIEEVLKRAKTKCPNTVRRLLVCDAEAPEARHAVFLLAAEKTLVMLESRSRQSLAGHDSELALSDVTDRESVEPDFANAVLFGDMLDAAPEWREVSSDSDAMLDCFEQDKFDIAFAESPRNELLHQWASYVAITSPSKQAFQKQPLTYRYITQCFAAFDRWIVTEQLCDKDMIDHIHQLRQSFFKGEAHLVIVENLIAVLNLFQSKLTASETISDLNHLLVVLAHLKPPAAEKVVSAPSPVSLTHHFSSENLPRISDSDDSTAAEPCDSLEAMAACWLSAKPITSAALKETMLLLWYRFSTEAEQAQVDGIQLGCIYGQLKLIIAGLQSPDPVLAPLWSHYAFWNRMLECLEHLKQHLPQRASELDISIQQIKAFSQLKIKAFNTELALLYKAWVDLKAYKPQNLAEKKAIEAVSNLFLPVFGDGSLLAMLDEKTIAMFTETLKHAKYRFAVIYGELQQAPEYGNSNASSCVELFEVFNKELKAVLAIARQANAPSSPMASRPPSPASIGGYSSSNRRGHSSDSEVNVDLLVNTPPSTLRKNSRLFGIF